MHYYIPNVMHFPKGLFELIIERPGKIKHLKKNFEFVDSLSPCHSLHPSNFLQ
jgi:hypothetical protein